MIHHLLETEPDLAGSRGYRPASLMREGFIHCSETPAQALAVAARWFAGATRLIVWTIDEALVDAPIVREAGRDRPHERFPHIYGPLALEAVVARQVMVRASTDDAWVWPR
ncbi:MAG: DUF952 domain-containing protein [Phycisphaerales bacterium]|nr:DUF952 domain-containing protein [Phycisphaerales bacterium]